LNKAVHKVKDNALIMSIEMNKAKAAHDAYSAIAQEEKNVKDNKEKEEWNQK
jgi:hypothetical protein